MTPHEEGVKTFESESYEPGCKYKPGTADYKSFAMGYCEAINKLVVGELMKKHAVRRSNDEYECSCGLRWDIDEDDPHEPSQEIKEGPPPMIKNQIDLI